jgi:glyoxylase-like metal-dependent hydrolase (beta-lactamase superfamily II)
VLVTVPAVSRLAEDVRMKLHLLDLGTLDYDEGWPLAAAGVSTASEPAPASPRRRVAIIGALVDHPKIGPVLFDTGAAANFNELWPPVVQELFAITRYDDGHHLDNAIQAAGYGLEDIKAIVLSHLHLDHAGGLEFFRGRDVPVYVHGDELKNAFYAVATGEDLGAYLPHYLDHSFNWQPLHGDQIELFDDFTLHRLPGHTPALLGLRLDLANAGTFILTSDQFHLRDNYEGPQPLGWLLRDHAAWWRSYRLVKTMADRTAAKLLFGHDADVLADLKQERFYD